MRTIYVGEISIYAPNFFHLIDLFHVCLEFSSICCIHLISLPYQNPPYTSIPLVWPLIFLKMAILPMFISYINKRTPYITYFSSKNIRVAEIHSHWNFEINLTCDKFFLENACSGKPAISRYKFIEKIYFKFQEKSFLFLKKIIDFTNLSLIPFLSPTFFYKTFLTLGCLTSATILWFQK